MCAVRFLERYWPAILVLVLPPLAMGLVKFVPLQVLPKAMILELKPSCFLRGFDEFDAVGKIKDQEVKPECKGAAPPPEKKTQTAANQPDKGKQAATGTARGAPKQKSPGAASKSGEKGDGEGPKTLNADKPGGDKARTLVQFRALEVKARAEFGIGSATMQAVALGGLIFALYGLVSAWRSLSVLPRHRHPVPANSTAVSDRWFLACAAVLAFGISITLLCHDVNSTDFDNILVNVLLEAAMAAKLFGATTFAAFKTLVAMNLLLAYAAGALLLVYLAVLTIPAAALGDTKDRVAALQFIVLIGGAIFALSAVANSAGVAWATLGLDEGNGAALIEATKSILKLWELASSGFLITAIMVGYFGIRRSGPAAHPGAAADSALALRTPGGDDFKAFGWIVQFIIALAPVWLPASVSALLKAAQMP